MANEHSTRTCSMCKTTFRATSEFFHKLKAGKFGLAARCKSCAKASTAKWHADNPGKTKATMSALRKANPAAEKAKCLKYNEKNREKRAEAARQWREENPERSKAACKDYRERNPEKVAQMWRDYVAANRDKVRLSIRKWLDANEESARQKRREWRQTNAAKTRAYVENRRAKKAGAAGKVSTNIADTLFLKQGGKCTCCGEHLFAFHLDHIVPLVAGGAHDDSNLQLLLPKCNARKGSKPMVEYLETVAKLKELAATQTQNTTYHSYVASPPRAISAGFFMPPQPYVRRVFFVITRKTSWQKSSWC